MKKFVLALISSAAALSLVHGTALASLVPCGQTVNNPCQLSDIAKLALNIFNFIVQDVAVPLAILMVVIGAVLLLVSGGNHDLVSRGKNFIWSAVIGIVIIFVSWVVIYTIIRAIGYTG